MIRLRCSYCGARTHTVANCPKTWGGSASRAAMRCTYCGRTDHKVTACPRLVRQGPADDYILDRK